MKHTADLFALLAQDAYREHHINVYTKAKHKTFWRVLEIIYMILTLGKIKNASTVYTTTLGLNIYYPLGWDFDKEATRSYLILRHEILHAIQYKKLGLGCVPLGIVVFLLLYCLIPVPVCFAWFRYRLERSAYLETCKARQYLGLQVYVEEYVDILSGPKYLWAWVLRKQISKWFHANLELKHPKEDPSHH